MLINYAKVIFLACSFFCGQIFAVEFDTSKLNPGSSALVEWLGYPVYIYKRTEEEKDHIQNKKLEKKLYEKAIFLQARSYGNEFASRLHMGHEISESPYRSLKEDILVVLGLSTSTGCAVSLVHDDKERFFDPCSATKYGLVAESLNLSSPYPLLIPPHSYSKDILSIHEIIDKIDIVDFSPNILGMDIEPHEKAVEAIIWGKSDVLSEILITDPKVIHWRTKIGSGLLSIASGKNNLDVVRVLVNAGCDVNQVSNTGLSPIHFAAFRFDIEMAKYLITKGASLDGAKDKGVKSVREFMVEMNSDSLIEKIDDFIYEVNK
ncbi:ankyrin repeat domain-containing protein [Porticoccus sp. W117]|uniref:ankyrin repeat domain-containing protein n=1 Tax=Porticoccus sp. W117 TaxID=3054777 RepID=UPI0025955DDA|nr:ankyrin repeat domain-containing protein [Porticoccus sp. W117]MDM3870770.1 ankyrin repeat domain-containing protein [Porticoccus sp. W117]